MKFHIPEVKLEPLLNFTDGELQLRTVMPLSPFDLTMALVEEQSGMNGKHTRKAAEQALDSNALQYSRGESEGLQDAIELLKSEAFRSFSEEDIEVALRTSRLVYPMHWELYGYDSRSAMDECMAPDPGDYASAFKTTELRSLVVELFGEYRKDLAKVVVQAPRDSLFKAWIYAPFMPIDYVVDYLREVIESDDDTPTEIEPNVPSHRALLETLTVGDCRRLLRDEDPLISDAVLMWGDDLVKANELIAQQKKIKSARHLHDLLLVLDQGSAKLDYSIPDGVRELSDALTKQFAPGLNAHPKLIAEVILDSAQAADVGAALKNCAGGSHNRREGVEGTTGFIVLNRENGKPYALSSFKPIDSGLRVSEVKIVSNAKALDLEAQVKQVAQSISQ